MDREYRFAREVMIVILSYPGVHSKKEYIRLRKIFENIRRIIPPPEGFCVRIRPRYRQVDFNFTSLNNNLIIASCGFNGEYGKMLAEIMRHYYNGTPLTTTIPSVTCAIEQPDRTWSAIPDVGILRFCSVPITPDERDGLEAALTTLQERAGKEPIKISLIGQEMAISNRFIVAARCEGDPVLASILVPILEHDKRFIKDAVI